MWIVNYVIESICPAITACGMIILQSGNLTIPQAVGHRTIGLVETFTIPELVGPWQVHQCKKIVLVRNLTVHMHLWWIKVFVSVNSFQRPAAWNTAVPGGSYIVYALFSFFRFRKHPADQIKYVSFFTMTRVNIGILFPVLSSWRKNGTCWKPTWFDMFTVAVDRAYRGVEFVAFCVHMACKYMFDSSFRFCQLFSTSSS